MTDLPEDDESDQPDPEQTELKALFEEYERRFGEGPDMWALGCENQAEQLREAIRTGQPIKLDIPPDCVA
jgi:hypothetical protein